MKNIRTYYGLLSFFILLIGIVIYLLFRDLNNIILFTWISKPEFFQTILIPTKPSIFSSFLKYHLPDLLWFLSGILLLRFIWFYRYKEQNVYIIYFFLMGVIFEISQLSENIPGTFDCLDLFFMCMTALIEGLLYKIFIQRSLKWKRR
jgi:hypothetical protein